MGVDLPLAHPLIHAHGIRVVHIHHLYRPHDNRATHARPVAESAAAEMQGDEDGEYYDGT